MEGPEFFKIYTKTPQDLVKLLSNLKVLARSSPEDKYILVKKLKELGEVVAVTGDETNDAPALKQANVGLTMGSGTSVAKDAADIIILDDDFSTIVIACKWGRNIYENIRKFIQFQLTINLCALILIVFSAITKFAIPKGVLSEGSIDLPISPMQMIWLSLIMDSFVALALSTSEPDESLLDRKPYGTEEPLITPYMWVGMIVHSIFQLAFCLTLYLGCSIRNLKTILFPDQLVFTATQTNNTMVFNLFVWFQLWNEWNARQIRRRQWNICKNTQKIGFLLQFSYFQW